MNRPDMGIENWLANDELFFEQSHIGRQWELYIGLLLLNEGFAVKLTPKKDLEARDDIKKYKNQKDIIVGSFESDKQIYFEVKSRKLVFTEPSDFPFDTALVETVGSWKNKKEKPHVILLISQKTKKIVGINRNTEDKWAIKKDQYDSVRKITDPSYLVPKELLTEWESIVNWLHKILKVEKIYKREFKEKPVEIDDKKLKEKLKRLAW